jgi:hypothetical protein
MKGVSENLCTHGGDMLAYLYDEMPSADRDRFELHLSDCGTCIDDFAELSQSRYPVYEWKQTEFDPLSTPQVVIPYGEATASWFDKVRGAFTFSPRFAFGGVAALVLAAVVTAFVLFAGPSGEIAQSVEPSPSPTRAAVVSPNVADPTNETTEVSAPERTITPRVEKASVPVSSRQSPRPAKAKLVTPTTKKSERVPVYSTVDDEEDDSLRLADIFAELDTSE